MECSEQYACKEKKHFKVSFAYNGWTENQKLYCDKKIVRETGKFICLMVNSFACFMLLFLSDTLGRKAVIILNSTSVIFCLGMAYYVEDYYIKMMFLGWSFGAEGCFSSLFLFMMNEVSRKFVHNLQIVTQS